MTVQVLWDLAMFALGIVSVWAIVSGLKSGMGS